MFRIVGTEFELKGAARRCAAKSCWRTSWTRRSLTGNTTTEKLLTFNGDMQGKPGDGGGVAVKIAGSAEYRDDVVARGKSLVEHLHREQGDGELVSVPIYQCGAPVIVTRMMTRAELIELSGCSKVTL